MRLVSIIPVVGFASEHSSLIYNYVKQLLLDNLTSLHSIIMCQQESCSCKISQENDDLYHLQGYFISFCITTFPTVLYHQILREENAKFFSFLLLPTFLFFILLDKSPNFIFEILRSWVGSIFLLTNSDRN